MISDYYSWLLTKMLDSSQFIQTIVLLISLGCLSSVTHFYPVVDNQDFQISGERIRYRAGSIITCPVNHYYA